VKKEKMIEEIIEKAEKQKGGIVLLHDGRGSLVQMEKKLKKNLDSAYNRSWIPSAVEEIIVALTSKGFILNDPGFLAALITPNDF
jgi:hypothetical protein